MGRNGLGYSKGLLVVCFPSQAESFPSPPLLHCTLILLNLKKQILSLWSTFKCHDTAVGIRQPIFASAAVASADKPLRSVLLEVSKAYARSIKPEQAEEVTHDSLKKILRERMAAKERGEPMTGPVFL